MKRKFNDLFFSSLTATTFLASGLAYADDHTFASIPVFEGGVSASVGMFLVTPSSGFATLESRDNQDTIQAINSTPGYSLGIDASLGYILKDTANSVELLYRNITTSDSTTEPYQTGTLEGNTGYELEAFDLIFNQFMNLGEYMQMRFFGGLAYADIEFSQTNIEHIEKQDGFDDHSRFSGFGPRVGIDSRYDFGDDLAGFGIVGGGSIAFYLGSLETNSLELDTGVKANNNLENQNVTNIRANLGIDYVYFFENHESTVGLELGYMVDYYEDAAALWFTTDTQPIFSSVTFSGPYLNLKGVF